MDPGRVPPIGHRTREMGCGGSKRSAFDGAPLISVHELLASPPAQGIVPGYHRPRLARGGRDRAGHGGREGTYSTIKYYECPRNSRGEHVCFLALDTYDEVKLTETLEEGGFQWNWQEAPSSDGVVNPSGNPFIAPETSSMLTADERSGTPSC